MVAMLRANENNNVHSLPVKMRPVLECAGQVVLVFHNLMIEPERGVSVVRGYINADYYRTFIGMTEGDRRHEQLLTQITEASGMSKEEVSKGRSPSPNPPNGVVAVAERGGKGHGGAIVPVGFGQLASVDGLPWSCRAARRGTGRSRSRSPAGLARGVGGRSVGWWVRVRSAGQLPPSGRERQGAQPCQGATELVFPGPALGQMQSELACRAGEPSGAASGSLRKGV